MDGKKKVALTFAFYEGDTLVRRETVAQDIVKVGKDPKSHLRVDDEAASRMHAVIEVQDDVTLIDLGNEAGTMVNGARVNKCKLNPGDQIQIGNTLIVLEKVEEAAAVAAAVPAEGGDAVSGMGAAAAGLGGGTAVMAPMGGADIPAPPANPFGASGGSSNPFAAGGAFGSANPFAVSPSGSSVPDNAPEGSYEYKMIKAGPDVPSEEVESPATALEVRILWGRNLLHVDHLSPPRSYYVGKDETGGKNKALAVDYNVPAEKIGSGRVPVVVAHGGSAAAIILPNATGTVQLAGQPKMTLQEAISGGHAQPASEVAGAHQIPLQTGTHVHMEVGDLAFEVASVSSGKKVAAAFTMAAIASGALLYVLGSFVGHAGLLAAMAMFMPPLGDTSDDSISDDQRYLIQQYLDSAAEKEMEEKETEQIAEDNADNKEGGTGTRAKGEEGSMGNPNTKLTGNRYGVAGPADNADPHIARAAALRDAAEF
ncbi:MAG: FHA domain-containing protein, partial [Myxococcales bacterium]|nr:FHA domain-containing protein [Myxococcales bacterium]